MRLWRIRNLQYYTRNYFVTCFAILANRRAPNSGKEWRVAIFQTFVDERLSLCCRNEDDNDLEHTNVSRVQSNNNYQQSVHKHQAQPQSIGHDRNGHTPGEDSSVAAGNKYLKPSTKNYSKSEAEHHHQDVPVKLVKHQTAENKAQSDAPKTSELASTNNNRQQQAYGSTFTDFRNMSLKETSNHKVAFAKPVSQVNGSSHSNHNEDFNSSQRFLKKTKQLKVESLKGSNEETVDTPRPHIDVPGKQNGLAGKNNTYTVSFNATGQQHQGSSHDTSQADRKPKVHGLSYCWLPHIVFKFVLFGKFCCELWDQLAGPELGCGVAFRPTLSCFGKLILGHERK